MLSVIDVLWIVLIISSLQPVLLQRRRQAQRRPSVEYTRLPYDPADGPPVRAGRGMTGGRP